MPKIYEKLRFFPTKLGFFTSAYLSMNNFHENTLSKKEKKLNKSLSKIPFTENNPIIVSYYKVDNVKFIEVIEPEPLP